MVIPSRTELVIKLPVKNGIHVFEGVTEKQEVQKGVYLAGAMTKVQEGYAITSIANTNSEVVETDEPVLELTEIVEKRGGDTSEKKRCDNGLNRAEEVLKQLSLDHLNKEEREQIEKTCADYHDIFHLPGEKLTSTTAVTHEIRVEPGTKPINLKPCRLPETHKQEAGRRT